MWVPRAGTNSGRRELCGRVQGSDSKDVSADGPVIQLVTRCNSVEEFIERFARFTTETEIVVPALPHASTGATGKFVICLKDHSEVMKGRCEVIEIRPVAVAPDAAKKPWGPMVMRLRLREMDAHSCGIHLRLMERHAASMKAPSEAVPAETSFAPPVRVLDVTTAPTSAPTERLPEAVPANSTVGDTSAVTVVSTEPPPSDARPPPDGETTEITRVQQPEDRAPAASFVLPANPLSELDASDLATFVELTLLESSGARPMRPVLERARRIGRRLAPFAALAIIGVLVGMAVRPAPKAAAVTVAPRIAPPPVATPPPAAARPPAPAPRSAAGAPEGEPVPRDCVARVKTTPAGADVMWGEIALGSSPIGHAAVPCGPATVTLRRAHYADVTRTMAAHLGHPVIVAQRLERPAATVVVTSSPPHALIKMNRHRVGPAPREISTRQYQRVRIEASLPGYRPWKQTVYLKEAEAQFDVELVRLSDKKARRTTLTSAAPARSTAPPPPTGTAGAVASR
jgi:hypothetical protein